LNFRENFKNPKYSIPKLFRHLLSNPSMCDTPNHKIVKKLISDGGVSIRGVVSKKIISNWLDSYSIFDSNFLPSEGNVTWPFYNNDIHNLLQDSKFMSILDEYFIKVYGLPPVLQVVPSLVITKPSIQQDSPILSKKLFPAEWHIDYPGEFTVHIPLVEITTEVTHTKYCRGTQYSLMKPKERLINKNNLFLGTGSPGDVIMMDVDGWHAAQLKKNSFRALVQLKFTTGNNLLYSHFDAKKRGGVAKRFFKSIKDFRGLQSQIKEDYKFLMSVNSKSKYKILGDNLKYYNNYL
jgi:hypothetical protein